MLLYYFPIVYNYILPIGFYVKAIFFTYMIDLGIMISILNFS